MEGGGAFDGDTLSSAAPLHHPIPSVAYSSDYSKMPVAYTPEFALHSPCASPMPEEAPKKRRNQVKMACGNCQKACKKCDEARPCARCVRCGLADSCANTERKVRAKGIKRGPYKRKNKQKDQVETPAHSLITPMATPAREDSTPESYRPVLPVWTAETPDQENQATVESPRRSCTPSAEAVTANTMKAEPEAMPDNEEKLFILSAICSAVLDDHPPTRPPSFLPLSPQSREVSPSHTPVVYRHSEGAQPPPPVTAVYSGDASHNATRLMSLQLPPLNPDLLKRKLCQADCDHQDTPSLPSIKTLPLPATTESLPSLLTPPR